MKRNKGKIINNLAFRVITPVLAIMFTIGIGMYLFVLSEVSDFIDMHRKNSMSEIAKDIYGICERNLQELRDSGSVANEKLVRIKRGRTLGAIEGYMTDNNFKGFIMEGSMEALKVGNFHSDFTGAIIKETRVSRAPLIMAYGTIKYYVIHFDFNPWEWEIFILRDAAAYDDLKNKVRFAYSATILILSVSVVLLLYYLTKAVKHPLDKILTPVRIGEMPEYKGIREFEFLSDSIRNMMIEKQRMMKQLVTEQKLKGIRVLASGVAHNFNNMLVGVLGYASLIDSKLMEAKKTDRPLQGQMLDEIQEYVNIIKSSSQNASRLAKELAELSKRRTIERSAAEPVDVNSIITTLSQMLVNTFSKSIEIIANLTENLPTIKGDAFQLEQALLNICINSKDAMPKGGKLIIETNVTNIAGRNPQYPYLKPGSYVTIKVSDTGIGMDEETLSHVFEPFFTTKPIDKGTGLGLATVYSIVKAHNGYVTAESSPDSGSVFIIYLPVANS
ncbi:MAG: ATP-binding protein [Thermodesulfovibrionales bacterium]|nr:ATP-binding protein [Thermodesulfovibrionales bacterium]